MLSPSARLGVPVDSMMTRRVVQAMEETPMAEVRNVAAKYDYNGFPIVTREGRLIGIVTKGDLLRVALAAIEDAAVWRQPVSRWMAHGVLALRPTDPVGTAVEHMVASGLRSLPVIDADSRVVGMLSRNDLMVAIAPEVPA